VGRVAFLTNRSPSEALPSLETAGIDLKTVALDADGIRHLSEVAPSAVIVDAVDNPEHAFHLMTGLGAGTAPVPVLALVARTDLERFPWAEVAEELLIPGTPPMELRVRLEMLVRRTGGGGEAAVRLGPLSIDTERYQVSVGGRLLDLTFKEFELLRFLVQRPGRVFTRSDLLSEVWGYNFYGGTRTVDVHVRRLRAKLGPEHEALIQTVRGVGYGAADPGRVGEGSRPGRD